MKDRGARSYAQGLLASLGLSPSLPELAEEHPALVWARSGLMSLTGLAGGPPQMCPVPLAACANGALLALRALAPGSALDRLRGASLLGERAAIAGLRRAGPISPGGSCRLLDARDGSFAVNLARDDDWASVPAWLECEDKPSWDVVQRVAREKPLAELLERGRLLGLAIAANRPLESAPVRWYSLHQGSIAPARPHPSPPSPSAGTWPRAGEGGQRPLVVDLSSLWAGPLCTHLLGTLGAEVIKVESPQRPDGARQGPAAFFDLLNAGKKSVALDPHSACGRAQLRALLAKADIVIEASRPRALRQLGIEAEALIRQNPRLTWVSITGYGRAEPQANWVAFGDDAGVAAGLSHLMQQATGLKLLCGDAMADPLTGLHAALAAWAGFLCGGGCLISLPLRDVLAHCIQFDLPPSVDALRERRRVWTEIARSAGGIPGPRARAAAGRARPLGVDTVPVLTRLGIAC